MVDGDANAELSLIQSVTNVSSVAASGGNLLHDSTSPREKLASSSVAIDCASSKQDANISDDVAGASVNIGVDAIHNKKQRKQRARKERAADSVTIQPVRQSKRIMQNSDGEPKHSDSNPYKYWR